MNALRRWLQPGYSLLVLALAAAVFLQWTGSSAVLPLLPIYLAERDNPTGLIGAVMASFFATGVLAQYLSGRLGDRIGHRRVLLTGLIGYALASAGFLLEVNGWGYLGLRGAQGAAAGAAQVACLSLVARAVPLAARGRAFAIVSGAELAGIAVGPMLGTAVGIAHMGTLFVVSAAAALAACIPVLLSRAASVDLTPHPDAALARLPRRGVAGRALTGVLLVAVIGGVLTGVYEACWSLLMDARGATDAQIGLSWTLFAVPFAIIAPFGGWLADRQDRRVLVMVGLLSGSVFAGLYPFLPSVGWLIGLGMVESVGFVFAVPAAQSLLTEHVPDEAAGRAQGLFTALQTAAVALSAGVCGAAFGVADWLPFVGVMLVTLVLLAVVPFLWRQVPGRVQSPTAPSEAAATRVASPS
ncbi:MAG: MFS transporter [Kineosporiaceae bacterium]|nr:MFS transporter [Kineosporiaceae bacterium]MBK7622201.1 MFS transporter [Kineosporiaceae bacterium]MBK8074529.1 MFS transporter [Kineosporiaceae bacterium]